MLGKEPGAFIIQLNVPFDVSTHISDYTRRLGHESDGRRSIRGDWVQGTKSGQDGRRRFTQVRSPSKNFSFE